MIRFALCFFILLTGSWAQAATTDWMPQDNAKTRVIYGLDSAGTPKAAIEIKLDDHWKTYWRSPGDAGVAVTIELDQKNSKNIKAATVQFPPPSRFLDYGHIQSFGYKKQVVLPLDLKVARLPAELSFVLNYAVCKELCLFHEQPFVIRMDRNTALSPEEQKRISSVSLPVALAKQKEIKIQSVLLTDEQIIVEATHETGFKKPDLLIEESAARFRFPAPEIHLSDGGKNVVIRAPFERQLDGATLDGADVVMSISDQGKIVEWNQALEHSLAASEGAVEASLWLMILFAVIGGFILNIMPCVLPVLSLKVLSVLNKTGKERAVIRRSFLASTLGILASFLALALLVVSLKNAGTHIGWGFQFQEPYFLIVLAIILSLFAGNLFGLFEIQLPHNLTNWLHRKSSKEGGKEGYLQHFLTGAFATLMATPCSAPFLGTAIGFAFSQGAWITIALFLAMGFGLSLPYLAFAIFPSMVKALPKPGPWMLKAKAVFGLLLLLTALWVLWVLAMQLGLVTSLLIGLLCVAVVLALKLPQMKLIIAALLVLFAALALVPQLQQTPEETSTESQQLWQPFDEAAIAREVALGNVVFVDVTASWCLTCKANKLLVLDTEEVRAALGAENVLAMQADWTNRDETIADYLKRFGRFGIPFNVVYGPGAPEGKPLPELLTKDLVLDALENAKQAPPSIEIADPRPAELPSPLAPLP